MIESHFANSVFSTLGVTVFFSFVLSSGNVIHSYAGTKNAWIWLVDKRYCTIISREYLRGLKCAKKTSPTPLHHHQQPAQWEQAMMDPCSHSVYAKLWLYHLNVSTEIETHQTRQHFSSLQLSKHYCTIIFRETHG